MLKSPSFRTTNGGFISAPLIIQRNNTLGRIENVKYVLDGTEPMVDHMEKYAP